MSHTELVEIAEKTLLSGFSVNPTEALYLAWFRGEIKKSIYRGIAIIQQMDLTKGKENHKLRLVAPVAQVDRATDS